METTFNPFRLLPVQLWQVVVAHVDSETGGNIRKASKNLHALIDRDAEKIFKLSGATEVPQLVVEYAQLTNQRLDFMEFCFNDTFHRNIYSFADLVEELRSNRDFAVIELDLGDGNGPIRGISPANKVSKIDLSNINWIHQQKSLPSGVNSKIRVKCTGLGNDGCHPTMFCFYYIPHNPYMSYVSTPSAIKSYQIGNDTVDKKEHTVEMLSKDDTRDAQTLLDPIPFSIHMYKDINVLKCLIDLEVSFEIDNVHLEKKINAIQNDD